MTIRVASALAEAGREFAGSWPRLLATDLLNKLMAFVVLVPLSGLALRGALAVSGGPVLADQDILFFVLTPLGLLCLVVLAGLTLAILAIEQACLMTIAYGTAHGVRVPVLSALVHALRNAPRILALAVRILVSVLLLAAPFLALMAVAGLRLLTEFDINFYLSERPPEFWTAAAIIGALALGLGVLLIPRLAGWTYALPILLFERASPRQAPSASRERVAGDRWRIGAVFVAWLAASALAGALVLGLVGGVGRWVVPRLGGGLPILLTTVGLLFVAWALANLLVNFFQNATFAVLVVGLYEEAGHEPSERALSLLRSAEGEGFAWARSPATVWAGAGALAVAAGIVGFVLLRSVQAEDDVVVIAHRGAAGAAPENTLASVERALVDGADVVEIDVQESADGEVVVAHDADLMKVARNPLNIWNATLAELAEIDIGSWFAPEFSGERVPTLRQVLERSRGRAMVDIELKYYGHDVRLEERVIEIVESLGMEDDVLVMSLAYPGVQKMRALRPGWRLGLLTATAVGDLTRLDADFLAVNTGIANRRFIRSAHGRGKDVYVWTVNDPVLMWQLVSMGVDGLITDEPALARQVLEYRAELSSAERLLVSVAIFLGERPMPSTPEEA